MPIKIQVTSVRRIWIQQWNPVLHQVHLQKGNLYNFIKMPAMQKLEEINSLLKKTGHCMAAEALVCWIMEACLIWPHVCLGKPKGGRDDSRLWIQNFPDKFRLKVVWKNINSDKRWSWSLIQHLRKWNW